MKISNPHLDLLILKELYYSAQSGLGLYRLFENINEHILFEDYRTIVKNSNIIDDSIKNVLLDDLLKNPYYFVNHEKELSENEEEILNHFEKEISPLSTETITLVQKNYENYAISYYINSKIKSNLPQDIISLYYNEKNKERLLINKNKDESFFFVTECFKFNNENEMSDFKSVGNFARTDKCIKSGFYESLELLKKDYNDYLNNFEKIR